MHGFQQQVTGLPGRFDRWWWFNFFGWKNKTAGQMMWENGGFENSTACPVFSKTPWWMVLKLFSKLKSGSFTHGWWGMPRNIIHMFMDGWNGWNFHGFPTMSLNLWGSFCYPLIFNVKLWTFIMLKSFWIQNYQNLTRKYGCFRKLGEPQNGWWK